MSVWVHYMYEVKFYFLLLVCLIHLIPTPARRILKGREKVSSTMGTVSCTSFLSPSWHSLSTVCLCLPDIGDGWDQIKIGGEWGKRRQGYICLILQGSSFQKIARVEWTPIWAALGKGDGNRLRMREPRSFRPFTWNFLLGYHQVLQLPRGSLDLSPQATSPSHLGAQKLLFDPRLPTSAVLGLRGGSFWEPLTETILWMVSHGSLCRHFSLFLLICSLLIS